MTPPPPTPPSRFPHAGISVSAIALGYAHTCVLASGSVKCWGWNNHGQLGIGSTTDQTSPMDVGADNPHKRVWFERVWWSEDQDGVDASDCALRNLTN